MKNGEILKEGRSGGKGGSYFLSALCNLAGTAILIMVIALCLPLYVPGLLGCEVYNVVSGSMEPEIPVGSMVFVKYAEPSEIQEGEVIAYQSGESVITHRVVQNYTVEGEFVTKGDANAEQDMETTPYSAVIGRVVRHVPMLGEFLALLTSTVGKVYLMAVALCGLLLNILAGHLRARARERVKEREKQRVMEREGEE